MRVRTISGALLLLIGAVWMAQGLNLLKGSAMTGESQWAAVGLGAAVVGVGLIGWEIGTRRR